jgi:hypothetical protein
MLPTEMITYKATRLHTSHDFLDKLRQLYDVKTDYGLHKLINVSRQAIYRYRDNASSFDEGIAIRVAELIDAKAPELKITPGYVLLCMAEERARTASGKKWWKLLREQLAVMVIGAIGLQLSPTPADAATLHSQNCASDVTEIHIAQQWSPWKRQQNGWLLSRLRRSQLGVGSRWRHNLCSCQAMPDDFARHFFKDHDGSWLCTSPATLNGPNGRIQVTAGSRFYPGTIFMGFDLASWLDQRFGYRDQKQA